MENIIDFELKLTLEKQPSLTTLPLFAEFFAFVFLKTSVGGAAMVVSKMGHLGIGVSHVNKT